eukprot:NODE_5482_length_648_cov_24.785029_g5318_i0.p1 GENE.NODE_5482_length_648_cov_24.785029_g5318_i0~~NODE_5482_length_648_cov_24.785029_g5318_i0.p1  ORF type:complete len:154 (-),score=32.38 NODE_5482_length_648_cov_24.785029_g5318_i0:121-582(-)
MDPTLAAAIQDSTTVMFVCSGNAIRSAFADVYSQHIQLRFPTVLSSGTIYQNKTLFPETAQALKQRSVDKALISKFRSSMCADHSFDPKTAVIFVMTNTHLRDIPAEWKPRSYLLLEVLGRKQEIQDPSFEGNYESAFAEIQQCVDRLQELRK